MSKLVTFALAILFAASSFAQKNDYAQYVNPFIGTDFHGHTFPGATLPFGMVQLSPDTRLTGWDGCSGYHYSDSVIYGFSHTHLSGTGVSDYGDILLMPTVGKPKFNNGDYSSSFCKKSEKAVAGYYSVFLNKPNVLAELTATARVGMHRYTFPKTDSANIVLDLEHRDEVLDSWVRFVSKTEIHGYRRSTAWAKDQHVYFAMRFSKPYGNLSIESNDLDASKFAGEIKKFLAGEPRSFTLNAKSLKVNFQFESSGEPIIVKVGISAVSAEGAVMNLDAELPHWDFDLIKKQAYDTWNKDLSKIEVEGGTNEQFITFYTALYHCFIHPNIFNDVDGSYRAGDHSIQKADGFNYYTVFSLWDTYRTLHPLLTIIDTKRTTDFIKTFLSMYQTRGLLPVWELAANETYCMIGYHSVSVIVDAWAKGIKDFDSNLALEAMKVSAGKNHFGLDVYRKFGHIAGDMDHEGVSKTLEYAYNDWCIAQFAKSIGKTDDYNYFIQRAQSYKNMFDAQTGFMRPRMNGGWKSPFDPTEVDFNFTEANSWQYSFYVPHDVSGLIGLHGGKANFERKLDDLFTTEMGLSGRQQDDITGLIGQYAHGNEPSHHMAYLYNFVNKPWKTQQRVRQIMDKLYSHDPDGLSGNEDCGQMSAWLVMSAMGFYPVTPGILTYTIGTPWFKRVIVNLENGKKFVINAPYVSNENIYIQSAQLNGKAFKKGFLNHSDIVNGGIVDFTMRPKPSTTWAANENDIPKTAVTDNLITIVPFVVTSSPTFSDSIAVTLESIQKGVEIFYTIDGSEPSAQSTLYKMPIKLFETTLLKIVAISHNGIASHTIEAKFFKIKVDWAINIKSKYNRQYTAGGPEGLIDGIRGAKNFRLGGWQGYQNQDFEATIDLGSEKPIAKLSAGFLQDSRSWIMMPKSVEYWVSTDSVNFNLVATVGHTVPDNEMESVTADFEAAVNTNGRYVKVIARNYGALPQWHLGAGYSAFIFVDEVMVE